MNGTAILTIIGGWRAAVFLLLAIVFAIGTGLRGCTIEELRTERDAARTEVGNWREINRTNYANLLRALEINEQWYEGSKLLKARMTDVLAQNARRETRMATANTKATTERETLYQENDHVAIWGDAVVPSAVYDGLLNDWQRYQDAAD